MIKVPEDFTFVRLDSLSTITFPLRYHSIVGLGSPEAWHGSIATVLIGRVWFAGPIVIIGGGWSSTAVTSRYALVTDEPATLKPEQI